MKKVIIKTSIYTFLTVMAVRFFSFYSVGMKNKLAAMQFENSNFTYSLYKTIGNSGDFITLIIWLIGVYMCYRTISKYLKIKNKEKDVI